uniref:Ovule protein n=1 Tax=Caenorhabditis tropicalis TaxID=1561998 RepID=A0A1I7UNA2_9PELO
MVPLFGIISFRKTEEKLELRHIPFLRLVTKPTTTPPPKALNKHWIHSFKTASKNFEMLKSPGTVPYSSPVRDTEIFSDFRPLMELLHALRISSKRAMNQV